jgi:hypothetical protein
MTNTEAARKLRSEMADHLAAGKRDKAWKAKARQLSQSCHDFEERGGRLSPSGEREWEALTAAIEAGN